MQSQYSRIFRDYTLRATSHVLAEVTQEGRSISPELESRALQCLSYAIKIPEAWFEVRCLLQSLAPRLEQAGRRRSWMPFLEEGIERCKSFGDIETEIELRYYLGVLFQRMASWDDAWKQFEKSADLTGIGEASWQKARAMNRMAYVARQRRSLDEAEKMVNAAVSHLPEDDPEKGYSYFVLAAISHDRRDFGKAIDLYQKSLDIRKKTDDIRSVAQGLTNLGTALRDQGKYQEAAQCYEEAIEIFTAIEDPLHQAAARMNMGNVLMEGDRFEEAEHQYLLAEPVFRRTHAKRRVADVYNNLALVYRQLGKPDEARESIAASMAQYRELGDTVLLANAMGALGLIQMDAEQIYLSRDTFVEALDLLNFVQEDPYAEYLTDQLNEHLAHSQQMVEESSQD